MRFDIFELDEKGIIPKIGESEEDFLIRGNLIIEESEKFTDKDIIEHYSRLLKDFKPLSFQDTLRFRKIALFYIKNAYGMDLSWVKFLKIRPKFRIGWLLCGACDLIHLNVQNTRLTCPVIFIVYPTYSTIRHELLHAARLVEISKPILFSIDFEEELAENNYLNKHFFKKTYTAKKFLKIREKLQKYFGENHGYVFIRLNYNEIMNHILSEHSDPISYFKNMAKTELKHRIMCEQLGLL